MATDTERTPLLSKAAVGLSAIVLTTMAADGITPAAAKHGDRAQKLRGAWCFSGCRPPSRRSGIWTRRSGRSPVHPLNHDCRM
jgi:hypothetical protein